MPQASNLSYGMHPGWIPPWWTVRRTTGGESALMAADQGARLLSLESEHAGGGAGRRHGTFREKADGDSASRPAGSEKADVRISHGHSLPGAVAAQRHLMSPGLLGVDEWIL